MRKLMISFLLLWSTAAFTQDKAPPAETNERILEELRQLRAQVSELEKRINALEERSKKTGNPRPPGNSTERRPPDTEALARITLPENPTRGEMLEYVRAIARASYNQNSYGSADPQIEMLAKVGRKNADVLIETYDQRVDYYFEYALKQVAGEEHKDLVIAALAEHPRLASVVVHKGWAADAREVLTNALKVRPRYLPGEWIDAVASLRDPATYEDLRAYFIEGMNKNHTYDAIKSLPGIDLEDAVIEAWERPRGFPLTDEKKRLAPIAIGHGIDAALETAFGLLGGEKWLAERARGSVLRHTEAAGSDEEIKAFYERHKGQFRWDPNRRKFLVERR